MRIRSTQNAGIAAILLTCALAHAAGAIERISVSGDGGDDGIFDPSVEFEPGGSGVGGTGWLSYSKVYGGFTPFGPHVETHLANSLDGGASWSFVAVVNQSFAASLGALDGVWNYEVSSLVQDPGDPGREWKLFAHRVFRRAEDNFTGEQNVPAYSWITLRSAPHPAGPWSAERALMASGPLPPAPFSVEVAINALDPSLQDLLVYSEPGAFERDGVLYLSLTGLTAAGPDRILLLASDDHAASWRYVSTLLTTNDATALGYLSFDGSAIAEEAGRAFLLVTPESDGVLHDGTLVFEFADLANGALVRDAGVPVVAQRVAPRPGLPISRRGGQADFHEGATAFGLLEPAIQASRPEMFQIFATQRRLIEPSVPVDSFAGLALLAVSLLAARKAAHR